MSPLQGFGLCWMVVPHRFAHGLACCRAFGPLDPPHTQQKESCWRPLLDCVGVCRYTFMAMRWAPYGPHALLFHLTERPEEEAFLLVRSIIHDLETNPAPGVVDFVPGFTSFLIRFDPRVVLDPKQHALEWMARLKSASVMQPPAPKTHRIDVHYNGLDLQRVAEFSRMSVDQVIEAHSQVTYTVQLLGFAPGFAYLGGLNPRLQVPRLSTPRPRIPAGSVGIGGEHTGIYPLETAGGWNLIGRTSVPLFRPTAQESGKDPRRCFLLTPGDRVQLIPQ